MNFKKLKNCFIIAEVSANHGQKLQRAVEMIKIAKQCGADAVKFQCYTPQTLTINCRNKYFMIKHPKWGGQTLFELYKKAFTPWGWFKELKKAADDAGIVFFATAFDKTSVDLLEELKVPFHKIASFELVDLPLIAYAAKTKKPLLLSTGMASLGEIKEAVDTAQSSGAREVALLKCVSGYPASPAEMNLKTIPDMKKRFNVQVGLSDHSLGTGVSVAAVSLGAKIIEKHFTLSRKIKTPDSFFSIEPGELQYLVQSVRIAEQAIGGVHYGLTRDELKSRIFRRSIFAVKDISKGQLFSLDNIGSIRPAKGLAPRYLDKLCGKPAKRNIKRGTPLKSEDAR